MCKTTYLMCIPSTNKIYDIWESKENLGKFLASNVFISLGIQKKRVVCQKTELAFTITLSILHLYLLFLSYLLFFTQRRKDIQQSIFELRKASFPRYNSVDLLIIYFSLIVFVYVYSSI